MGAPRSELPAEDIDAETYAAYWCSRDGRNHLFERDQFTARADGFWSKCRRGKNLPQRTVFRSEMSQDELGFDRDTSKDCRTCFFTGPQAPQEWTW
jgi:hypothetical protein